MSEAPQALDYLDFEFSEDADGLGSWDALASVWPDRLAAVEAEIAAVLRWARFTFGAGEAPLDEGGDWDWALQAWQEGEPPQSLPVDAASGRVQAGAGLRPDQRITLSFTLGGGAAFSEAFRHRFGLSD